MFLILVFILLVTLAYYYGIKPLYFWKKKRVQQEPLPQALFSNYFGMLKRQQFFDITNSLYKKFPGHRYHGMYRFNAPVLVVTDTDLIKQMVIKDFEHFNNHREFISVDVDPVFGKTLFLLKGNEWRNMRSTLSPTFTSSKMKAVFSLTKEISQKLVEYLEKNKEDIIEVEMKDLSSRFCNDVIASTAFGTNIDSFNDPNNIFFQYGKKLTNLNDYKRMVKFMLLLALPPIAKILKIKIFDEEVQEFFKKVIDDTIRVREEKGVVRPDFIQILMEARKGNDTSEEQVEDEGFATVDEHFKVSTKRNITNEEIVAQALLFFFGGFDSISTLICFLAHELCSNQDVQDRLREEIEDTLDKCNGDVNYESLVRMKYMDMVVTEALRKWPTNVAIERVCTKPYVIEASLPHETSVNLNLGDTIFIPTYGIHRDPENFPDPDKFDPERFSDENKANVKPYTYQPFGQGPRNCIASRFALLETKIMFFYLLKDFKIVPTEKTKIPIQLGKSLMQILPPEGFWMGLQHI